MASRKRGKGEASDPRRKPPAKSPKTTKGSRRGGATTKSVLPASGPKKRTRGGGVRKGHGSRRGALGAVGARRGLKAVPRRGKRLADTAGKDKKKVGRKPVRGSTPKKKPVQRRLAPRKKPVRRAVPRKQPVRKAAPRKKPVRKAAPRKKPVRKSIPKRKPVRKVVPKRKPVRTPKPKKKPVRRLPPIGPVVPVPGDSANAENLIHQYLIEVKTEIMLDDPGIEMSVKTFINSDGTVDGELRLIVFPDFWKDPEGLPTMAAFLSGVFARMNPVMPTPDGGRFWISIGARFGPQGFEDIADLGVHYKRYRGQNQVAAHPVSLAFTSGPQNAIAVILHLSKRMIEKRGYPLLTVFVRVTWMPAGMHPSRFKGEGG